MNMRRGFFRLLLLATLAWVTFVAYSAWGRMPHYVLPISVTQLFDYCRYNFRIASNMRPEVVRYEAVAQYHRARTSVEGTNCRAFHQISEGQVADNAARTFLAWVDAERMSYERRHTLLVDNWMWNYVLHALAPPLLVWLLLLASLWVGEGFARREEA